MKGFRFLVFSTTFFLLLSLLACKATKKNNGMIRSGVDLYQYSDVVKSVLRYYHDEFGYFYTSGAKPCYAICSEISANTKSAYYFIWSQQIHNLRNQQFKGHLIQNQLQGISLDTLNLRKQALSRFELEKVDSLGGYCVEFFSKGNGKNELMSFSPLVKTTRSGYYHIALSINDDREQPEFLFLLEDDEGELKVVDHYWNDYWGLQGIPEGDVDYLRSF